MKKIKDVIIFLDTDKHVSPFDTLLVIDNFPHVEVHHYSQVEPSDARGLTQDAMFPRGPEGAAHTKLFIGGYDFDKAEAILETVKSTMFSPFEMAVIMDPRGANTTGAAMVTKVLGLLDKKRLGGFEHKKAAILAGTGPVGQICAKLMAIDGAGVSITSRQEAKAKAVAEKLNKSLGANKVQGLQASNPEETAVTIKDAEVILATGAAGTQLLPLTILKEEAKQCNVLADVNAVPPYGIEGLKPKDEGVEVIPGVLGVGALAIGALKNKVEVELIKRALASSKGIFDHTIAYQIAKSLAKKKK